MLWIVLIVVLLASPLPFGFYKGAAGAMLWIAGAAIELTLFGVAIALLFWWIAPHSNAFQ